MHNLVKLISKIITPLGGLLSDLPPQTQEESEARIKVNNRKLSELFYLPGLVLRQELSENHKKF